MPWWTLSIWQNSTKQNIKTLKRTIWGPDWILFTFANNEKTAFIEDFELFEVSNKLQWTWSLPRFELLSVTPLIFFRFEDFWKIFERDDWVLLILCVLGRVGLQSAWDCTCASVEVFVFIEGKIITQLPSFEFLFSH